MNSIPIIVSDAEEEVVLATSRQAVMKRRRVREIFGSDCEDEFVTTPRRKRSRIEAPKIEVRKVEIIRPARPTVAAPASTAPSSVAPAKVPTPETAVAGPSRPPSPPPPSAAQYFEEFCALDYCVPTPERAVTPGLTKAELLDYDQDAQPQFDADEVALMCDDRVFAELPSFNVLCDAAVVSNGFKLQEEYYSPKDNNNRLLKCAYAVVDVNSRKFLSVGFNPLKRFRPTVCLTFEKASLEVNDHLKMMHDLRVIKRMLVKTVGRNDRMLLTCANLQATLVANKQVRISVNNISPRSLKPHQLVILAGDEIDRILESEDFITSKIKYLRENSDLQRKYLQLLQSCAVRVVKTYLADSMLKETLRQEILSVKDNFLSDCWWEMFIYYSFKLQFDARNVLMHIKRKDELVVDVQ